MKMMSNDLLFGASLQQFCTVFFKEAGHSVGIGGRFPSMTNCARPSFNA